MNPLMQCLSDPAEMNREIAVQLLSRALAMDAAGTLHSALFGPILTVLVRRIGRTPFQEEAEEVRLLLAQLGNRLWTAPQCAKAVHARHSEIADIVRALSSDQFPPCKQVPWLVLQCL
jgi:hypothetical protein